MHLDIQVTFSSEVSKLNQASAGKGVTIVLCNVKRTALAKTNLCNLSWILNRNAKNNVSNTQYT